MKRQARESQQDGPLAASPSFEDAYQITRCVAGARAAAVARVHGLSWDERLDLEQDAALHVWRRLLVFDPEQSSLKSFIENIAANHLASAVRRLRAAKRQVPLIGWSPDHADSGADRIHLQIDVSRVLGKLPPAQRRIGLMLAHKSPSEVSRCEGVSRASVYRVIGQLRDAFTAAGFARCHHRRSVEDRR
jgi:RNA polymerase sigma factor (sigma-70 family)